MNPDGFSGGSDTKKDRQMAEILSYFMMFIENLNLTLQFVVEKLGIDSKSGEIGAG